MGLSKQLYEEITQLQNCVEEEQIEALEAYIMIRDYQKWIEHKKEQIAQLAFPTLQKQPDLKMLYHGFIVQLSQKATYEFKHIKRWVDKKKELTDIEFDLKANIKKNESFDSQISEFETGFIGDSKPLLEAAICKYSKPFLTLEKEKTNVK